MSKSITLKELLDFEFTANEDGEMIALVPLSRVNDIADILTNQKERIDKAIELIKRSAGYKGICTQPETDTFSKLLEILKGEN